MTQHCTITGTMLVPVHYIICTLKIVFFPEITVFVVVKINSFQCQCQCKYFTLLFQNKSCNDVGHDHYNKLYNDDEVLNYYVLPWFNYLSLSVYKLFYMQYSLIVFFYKVKY